MKKTIFLGLVSVLFIISLVFNVSFAKGLNEANITAENINKDLKNLQEDYEALSLKYETNRDSLVEELKKTKSMEVELSSAKELVESIDKKLTGEGEPIEKLERMLVEQSFMIKELEQLSEKLEEKDILLEEALKAQELKEEEDLLKEEVVEVVDSSITQSIKLWVNDIDEVIAFVEDRILDLDSVINTLPALSLERIMINQEIDYLNDIIDKLQAIKSSLNDY